MFAESLSYVDIFGSNYVELLRNGIRVKVASPSAFVIQKILINDRRGTKSEKDADAIDYVLSFICISRKSSKEFYELYDKLPRKWKKAVEEYINRRKVKLPERYV